MFIIGIDPHRGSHTAVVLDRDELSHGEVCITADRRQRDRLLAWAAPFEPRVWAIEGAAGTGALLAQQLVQVGETVLDVPPTLSARARLLDSGRTDKNDRHDARSAAVVALRHRDLRAVALEDQIAVLRVLAKRHHDLTAGRTRAICRLHTTLTYLVAGRLPRRLRADHAARILRQIHPTSVIDTERKTVAAELLAEVRRIDRDLAELGQRIKATVVGSNSMITDIYGVGPIVAAYILGYTGDITRFPSAAHYARYNATAPIETSSGTIIRHRLNPRGNRMLNHAMHMIAVTQVRNDTPGRAYYRRKQAEQKSRKEAMRALKRRISDTVYRQLRADANR